MLLDQEQGISNSSHSCVRDLKQSGNYLKPCWVQTNWTTLWRYASRLSCSHQDQMHHISLSSLDTLPTNVNRFPQMPIHTASEPRGFPFHVQSARPLIWGMPCDRKPVLESGGQAVTARCIGFHLTARPWAFFSGWLWGVLTEHLGGVRIRQLILTSSWLSCLIIKTGIYWPCGFVRRVILCNTRHTAWQRRALSNWKLLALFAPSP